MEAAAPTANVPSWRLFIEFFSAMRVSLGVRNFDHALLAMLF
jgi:hypothetical protein